MVEPREVKEVLSAEEAAKLLDIHIDTVRDWLRSGKLPGVKMGDSIWRIRRADIEAMFSNEAEHGK